MTTISNEQIDLELYILGFRLVAHRAEPDMYTLTAYGDTEFFIVANDKIVFFENIMQAPFVLEMSDCKMKELGPAPREINIVYDIPYMLHLIKKSKTDEACNILNCLNIFFDLLSAVNIPIRPEYKRVLYPLADHLTFDKNISKFIKNNRVSRTALVEPIEWCIETIFKEKSLVYPRDIF